MLGVGLKRCVQLLHVRVHHAHLQVNPSDLRMVLPYACLEDCEAPVQIFKALAHEASLVIVHGQHDIVVGNVGVINPQKSLL